MADKPEDTIQHDLQILQRDAKPSPELLLKDQYLIDFLGLRRQKTCRWRDAETHESFADVIQHGRAGRSAGWSGHGAGCDSGDFQCLELDAELPTD